MAVTEYKQGIVVVAARATATCPTCPQSGPILMPIVALVAASTAVVTSILRCSMPRFWDAIHATKFIATSDPLVSF
jgi:hypothetical protein